MWRLWAVSDFNILIVRLIFKGYLLFANILFNWSKKFSTMLLCYSRSSPFANGGKMNNNDLCLPTNSMSNLVPLSGRLSKWCNVPQRGKIKKNKIILPFFLICFLIIHLYPIMITFWSNKFVGHMRLFYKIKKNCYKMFSISILHLFDVFFR